MRLVRPVTLTDALLVSSTVAEPETGYPEYNPTAAYVDKAHVSLVATHRLYEAVGAVAAGNNPPDHPDKWIDLGPTNRWAMFDDSVGTLTTATGAFTVVLQPGSVDSLSVIDCDAELVTVTMTVGGSTVYSRTQSTNVGGAAVTDYFTYFFSKIGTRSVLTFLDLPSYPSAIITVLFTGANPGGPVSCGTLIVGTKLDIGTTEAGAKPSFTSFSKVTTDDFGRRTIAVRPWAKEMNLRVLIASSDVDAIYAEVVKVRDRACLWIGSEDYDSLIVYGFITGFDPDLAFPDVSYITMTIVGLT